MLDSIALLLETLHACLDHQWLRFVCLLLHICTFSLNAAQGEESTPVDDSVVSLLVAELRKVHKLFYRLLTARACIITRKTRALTCLLDYYASICS